VGEQRAGRHGSAGEWGSGAARASSEQGGVTGQPCVAALARRPRCERRLGAVGDGAAAGDYRATPQKQGSRRSRSHAGTRQANLG